MRNKFVKCLQLQRYALSRRLLSTNTNSNGSSSTNVAAPPVLCKTAIEYLEPAPQRVFIDMTFGEGGHTRQLLNAADDTLVYALDCDPVAHKLAVAMSKEYPGRLVPLHGKFSELPRLLAPHKIKLKSIDGILFDFGCSALQLNNASRGFSLTEDGPLDMRMNPQPGTLTAADIIARAEEHDLVRIFRTYGEERAAIKIARGIKNAQSVLQKVESTRQLAELVAAVKGSPDDLDTVGERAAPAATKVFRALRIFVNNELNEINYAMVLAAEYLRKNGRLVALSFSHLEDTIVKRHMSGNVDEGLAQKMPLKYRGHGFVDHDVMLDLIQTTSWKQLNKHVIKPDDEEVLANPRSRTARLRAAIRI